MNGAALYELATHLNGGQQIDEDRFYELLNMKKGVLERSRPWVYLLTENSANTVLASNLYTTQHTLPSNFGLALVATRKQPAMVLKSGEDVMVLDERPLAMRHIIRDNTGYFVVDHANAKIYVMGSFSQSYTMYFYYYKTTDDIASGTSWSFPSQFHPVLAFDVVAAHKGGVDYDDINARMVQYLGVDIVGLRSAMNMWNTNLQVSMLNS